MPWSYLPLLAQDAPAAAPAADQASPFRFFVMMAVVFAVFYFVMIRPQQRQERERREALGRLKKHDRVVLSGGMYGTVMDVKDDEVAVRVCESPDVRVRVRRAGILEILA